MEAKKCTVCSNEFEAKRSDAQYCSATCRSQAHRATDKVVSVATDNLQQITLILPPRKTAEFLPEDLKGYRQTDKKIGSKNPDNTCHSCGEEKKIPLCICHPCFAKEVTHKSLGLDLSECQKKNPYYVPTRGIFRPLVNQKAHAI